MIETLNQQGGAMLKPPKALFWVKDADWVLKCRRSPYAPKFYYSE